jgi:hypothetical protein
MSVKHDHSGPLPRSTQVQLVSQLCLVSPILQRHPTSVQAQLPSSVQVHVLQPSSAARISPAVHVWQSTKVQAHSPSSVHVQVLHPSPAGLLWPA